MDIINGTDATSITERNKIIKEFKQSHEINTKKATNLGKTKAVTVKKTAVLSEEDGHNLNNNVVKFESEG